MSLILIQSVTIFASAQAQEFPIAVPSQEALNETPQLPHYGPDPLPVIMLYPAPFGPQAPVPPIEWITALSMAPPAAEEPPPVPLRDNPFLTKQSSGELTIDVPTAQQVSKTVSKRKPKKFDASKFIVPDIDKTQDPKLLGVRLMEHAIQQTIDDKPEDAIDPITGKQVTGNALAANLPWFKTAGLEHQFQVRMRAADSSAALEYRGVADASFVYHTDQSALGVELKEEIAKNLAIVLGYVSSPIDNVHNIKLSWAF